MYRIALAGLLVVAFVDIAAACPPAPQREIEVNGVQVQEFYCPGGKVLFMHENIYRCFERSPQCPNGVWHGNKCHCFPGTHETRPGVCGKICANCQNGWCYSTSTCVCNDGFQMINGQCVGAYNIPNLVEQPAGCIPGFKRSVSTGRCEPVFERPPCPPDYKRNPVTKNCESEDEGDGLAWHERGSIQLSP